MGDERWPDTGVSEGEMMAIKVIRYIDLFAGIGGFRNGLEKANDTVIERTQQGVRQGSRNNPTAIKSFLGAKQFTCVWSNEWDKYARQIYKKHYGECDGRDIRTVPAKEIPDHDLLCAGFPCQSFSIAGKRKGFGDTRGTLFYEICRIARDKRPNYLLLENVKGLLSHQNGWTYATILLSLDDLGYDVEWQVLNSKNFGVPQNRERVFIVGYIRGERRPEVFPLAQSSQGNLAYSAGVVSAREKWLKDGKNYSREFSQGQRIYSKDGIAQTLAGNAGGQGGKTGLYQVGEKGIAKCLDANYQKGRTNHPQRTMITGNIYPSKGQAGQVFDPKGISKAIVPAKRGGSAVMPIVPQGLKIRRLTPVECERLQGFPDNWTEGISDTQRYKCLGNAVTTNVVRAIGEKLMEHIQCQE